MPLFTWSDEYSIGNAEIDNQHKKLFDILNRLFDICVGKNVVETTKEVTDDLVSYTDYHFKFEEKHIVTSLDKSGYFSRPVLGETRGFVPDC